MTLIIVLALAACAVALAPVTVRICDRKAGWPLAALFVVAAVLLCKELPGIIAGTPLTLEYTWVPDFVGDGVDVSFALRADALSSFFALLALGIGSVVFAYSASYLHNNAGNTSFYTIMTAFMASILLLVFANDAVLLFIAWELVSLASFMLIARSGGKGGELGSQRTLILTFIGGLTLLVAMAIASNQAGSTNIDAIIHAGFWAEKPALTGVVAVLVAVSAFTKSAQFPFHFWLPEAMAAATPVSAFLHAAAVVKAGIYVLLRFSAVFSDVAVWNWLLIVVGMFTAVMASFFAIQKTDMKKLTAYSTVSHLGWIVATIGVGTPFALAAAVVHTLAHALFKSSLFMLVGVVDHQAGTRDLTRLGSSWRQLPFTFGAMAIAAASMAAVPPLFGFVSKEGMLEAFLHAPIGNAGVVVLMVAAGVGALFTFTYSVRLVVDGFIDGSREMSDCKEAPVSLWLPAALPGVLSIPAALFVSRLDAPVSAAVSEVADDPHTHLAVWHGVTIPFVISMLVLVFGVLGLVKRQWIWDSLADRKLAPRSGNELLNLSVRGIAAFGRCVGSMADSLSPTRHLAYVFMLLVVLGGTVTVKGVASGGIDGVPLAPRIDGADRWADALPLAIIVLAAALLLRTKRRLTAVIMIGVVGVGVTVQMLMLGSPDVALTQFMVEALTVVIMMMVIRQQPDNFHPGKGRRKAFAAVMAVAVGVVTFLMCWFVLGRRERPELAIWYLNNGPDITGGDNVVNTILVEFRAFDTMGELSVLGMAAVVIAAVVTSMPRYPFAHGTHPAPFGLSHVNSIPLRQLLRVLIPILGILSFAIFMRGHNSPGGGFIAALVAGGALMLSYLSHARDQHIFTFKTPIYLTSIGIILALISGFLGLTHGSFLYALHGHWAGEHWTTAMIFDLGVYLAVLGMLSMAINALGSYLRPGMDYDRLNFTRDESPLVSPAKVEAQADDDLDWPETKSSAQASQPKEA
ncbi:hypothetical protein FRC0508_00386 [Corynebacterium diphtheriae]|nr:hypothetical protein FRC0049_00365 [Corynebacterium diphtheriae]CAB0680302.1 hypothetical protein FRC0050_00393 [Corynebacterium diphtheriae]CAB0875988.1 hypothetical protein FRC0408_00132 [Corynebacterium diphtheriae]CAB0983610.1 hypothetical protein FRC0508_00386 [Corynebacterium diphtheriae]